MLAGGNAVGCFDLKSSVGLGLLLMRLWPHILEKANWPSGQGAKPVGRDAIREPQGRVVERVVGSRAAERV